MVPHGRENKNMVLLKAERAQAALTSANEALEHGEVVSAKLNQSLSLLRSRRDELAQKIETDLARAALSHLDASPAAIPAPPAPPVLVWKFL
jgi:hypothetical protein